MRELAVGSSGGASGGGTIIFSGFVLHETFNILASNNSTPENAQNVTAKFNPSMAIIIIVLISAFLLMGFFSIYVRRCTTSDDNGGRGPGGRAGHAARGGGGQGAGGAAAQGLNRAVVESLPLVGYNLVKGLDGGKDLSECAVCLSDFEDDENLRLLPKCGHVFHPDCIDMWFSSHSTCPLCRASLLEKSESGKVMDNDEEGQGVEALQMQSEGSSHSHRIQVDELAQTIHDGPPLPPNGSILELLAREGADRLLANSLRRDDQTGEPMLARAGSEREGPSERAREMRALRRALSRNSMSFRRASRGIEASHRIGAAATDSMRFDSKAVAAALDASGMGSASLPDDKREKGGGAESSTRTVFADGRPLHVGLKRSSSVGSSSALSEQYVRQLFGNHSADYFASDADQRWGPARREQSETELGSVARPADAPAWETIDLNGEEIGGGSSSTGRVDRLQHAAKSPAPSPTSSMWSGEIRMWGRGRKASVSGELSPSPAARRMDINSEASGPLYVRRKGKESIEERAKSDRWNFGQSFRRTFSLRRTYSESRDSSIAEGATTPMTTGGGGNSSSGGGGLATEPARWYTQMISAASPSAKKLASPWAGAAKARRMSASSLDLTSTPPSPSMAFPAPLPVSDRFQQRHQQPPQHQQMQQP